MRLSIYNIYNRLRGVDMKNEPLRIKRKAEDGSRIISVRIKDETLNAIDKLAAEANYSRNELINLILSHGIHNVEIEHD